MSLPRCGGLPTSFPIACSSARSYLPLERLVAYYGRNLAGMHLPFNFSLLNTPWDAPSIARLIAEYEAALPAGGWPNWVLGNHDRPRIASRVGPDQVGIAAMLLLTLRGTPTIYYGDEIAMKEVAIAPDQVRDPLGKNVPGQDLGRDGCRTPTAPDAPEIVEKLWDFPSAERTQVQSAQPRRQSPM